MAANYTDFMALRIADSMTYLNIASIGRLAFSPVAAPSQSNAFAVKFVSVNAKSAEAIHQGDSFRIAVFVNGPRGSPSFLKQTNLVGSACNFIDLVPTANQGDVWYAQSPTDTITRTSVIDYGTSFKIKAGSGGASNGLSHCGYSCVTRCDLRVSGNKEHQFVLQLASYGCGKEVPSFCTNATHVCAAGVCQTGCVGNGTTHNNGACAGTGESCTREGCRRKCGDYGGTYCETAGYTCNVEAGGVCQVGCIVTGETHNNGYCAGGKICTPRGCQPPCLANAPGECPNANESCFLVDDQYSCATKCDKTQGRCADPTQACVVRTDGTAGYVCQARACGGTFFGFCPPNQVCADLGGVYACYDDCGISGNPEDGCPPNSYCDATGTAPACRLTCDSTNQGKAYCPKTGDRCQQKKDKTWACFGETAAEPRKPGGEKKGVSVWVWVGIGAGVLLLLMLLAAWWKMHKAKQAKATAATSSKQSGTHIGHAS